MQAFQQLITERGPASDGARGVVEGNKRHPQAFWDRAGRLRVEVKGKDGTPSPLGLTKQQLLEGIATRIPGLPQRALRMQAFAERAKAIEDYHKKNPRKQAKKAKR